MPAVPSVRVEAARHGGPDVLRAVAVHAPPPGPGRVRLRVQAAGVALADVMARRGVYPGAPRPPFAPGFDVVGVVDEVGEGVAALAAGDRVAAMTVFGGYAEHVEVAASDAVPVPAPVDAAEAVALVLNYVTAHQVLHRSASVEAGQTALVHGAAGGVGTALLELGRLAGLRLVGTASAGKHGRVRSYGAEPVDYAREDFVDRVRALGGADAAFDAVGGWHFARSWRALRPGGVLVPYGIYTIGDGRALHLAAWAGQVAALRALAAVPGRRVARFYDVVRTRDRRPGWFRRDLGALLGQLAEGALRPVVGLRLPLSRAAEAHRVLEGRAVEGKVVLVPDGGSAPSAVG